MTRELQEFKPKPANTTIIPYPTEGNVTTASFQATSLNSTYMNMSNYQKEELTTAITTMDAADTSISGNASLLLPISPQCFKELVHCIIDATTFQNSSQINNEKEMVSLLVNVTATLIPLILEIFLQSNQTSLSPEHPSTVIFTPTESPWLNRSSDDDDMKNIVSSLTTTFVPTLRNNFSEGMTNEFSTTLSINGNSKSLTLAEFYTTTDQPLETTTDLPFTNSTENTTVGTDEAISTFNDEESNTTNETPITLKYYPLSASNLTEENDTNSTDTSSNENYAKTWNSLFQDDDPRFYNNGTSYTEDETTETPKAPLNKRETTGYLEDDLKTTIEDNDMFTKSTIFTSADTGTSHIISMRETMAEKSTEHRSTTEISTMLTNTMHEDTESAERDDYSGSVEGEATEMLEAVQFSTNTLSDTNLFDSETMSTESTSEHLTTNDDSITITNSIYNKKMKRSGMIRRATTVTSEPPTTKPMLQESSIHTTKTIKPSSTPSKTEEYSTVTPEIEEFPTLKPEPVELVVSKGINTKSFIDEETATPRILGSSHVAEDIATIPNTRSTFEESSNAESTTKLLDDYPSTLFQTTHYRDLRADDSSSTPQNDEVTIPSTKIQMTDEASTTKPSITESIINNPPTKTLISDDYTIKLANAFFGYAKIYKREVPKTKSDIKISNDFLDLSAPLPLIRKNYKDSNTTASANLGSANSQLEKVNDSNPETINLNKTGEEIVSAPETNLTNELPFKDLKHNQTNAKSFLVAHIVTIILTAAIMVSKEEDSKLMTEKLFERDEKKIAELVAAWKESLQQERQMKNGYDGMWETCFTVHCRDKSEERSLNKLDVNKPQQNFSTATHSSEDNQSKSTANGFYLEKIIGESDKISTESPVYAVKNQSLTQASYVDGRKLRQLCWETMFGQELVKLTVMDLVLTIASTLLVDFFRALFVRVMNHCWCWDLEKQFPQYGDFKIAENILHLVYNQGMVWMGMFFSPGLPALNLAKLAIVLYVRSWIVLTCNVPHDVVFRASRSNNFYLALLLTMLFLCALPVGYALVWVEPSWHCGPFAGKDRISSLFTSSVRAAFPDSLRPVLDYVASPALVIPLLVLLVLVVAYLLALAAALREANDDLRIQLRRERTEERRKMFRIANGRGRRGRKTRGGMPRDCRAASDDASAMGVMDDFVEGETVDGDVVVEVTPIKEAEEVAVQAAGGWRGLIGRITNLRAITSRSNHNADKTEKSNSSAAKESKTPENKCDEGEVSRSIQMQRTPSVETTRRQIRCVDEIEDGILRHKSSSSSRGDRDSPTSTCWSGDIPLIRIVRTADDGNRTPQQAQPQQPTGSYENPALDQTSESNPQDNFQSTDK
ncbi:hypothetical protein J437_LFUL012320 [Ladona fulva]|uniref:TMC domain-containing protein n=1 Tax=Ladona fulva TaxID=123851 RepID=A0A8K0KB69_LADFU|nr:hypothetical protein J437_LFUL012320 [Ladona fulva]